MHARAPHGDRDGVGGPEHHHSIPPRGARRGSSNSPLPAACGRSSSRALARSTDRNPPTAQRLDEEYPGAPHPEDPSAGYAHGKRVAEFLCSVAAAETNLRVKIARCFAFVGPLLPLDLNFAIGNFIRDAERSIEVEALVPLRRRPGDLALDHPGQRRVGRPYNVGSEADLSIAELARLVGQVLNPGIPVHIQGTPVTDARRSATYPRLRVRPQSWPPHSRRSPDAVRRTADWHFPDDAYATGPDMTWDRQRWRPTVASTAPTRETSLERGLSEEVRLGDRPVDGHPAFVLAEIGINHNGDVNVAKKLIDVAVFAGCEAVKFQKRTVDVVYTPAELAKPRESPFGETNGDLKRGLELGLPAYQEIDAYCRARDCLDSVVLG